MASELFFSRVQQDIFRPFTGRHRGIAFEVTVDLYDRLLGAAADYDLVLKGQVRHAQQHVGLGIEFREIRKGDRQILQFLMRKLGEKQFEETLQFEVHR